MPDTLRTNVDLKPIFNKLGHKIEEIRVRALNSLLSKLEHNLVCEVDVIQERHLFIRLLEWFNFPSSPQQKDVLGLLQRLTKHVSGAGLVVEIGGVEFLTQLRANIEPSLQSVVDATLDQLFHLPTSPPAAEHSAECIYKSSSQDLTSHVHTTSTIGNQSALSAWSSQTGHTRQSAAISDHNITPRTSSHALYTYSSPSTISSPPDSQAGYFGHSVGSAAQRQYAGVSAACMKFSTFPWIALMPTDRHVLSSTDASLRTTDPSHIVSACEFLSDVVFQDFPAEVFLQRPAIVKSLLSLVNVRPTGGTEVRRPAVQALRDLSVSLKARIRFYQDPALYTPKQDFATSRQSSTSTLSQSLGSSDTRPSLVGRSDGQRFQGDGQDGDLTPGHVNSSGLGEGHAEELDYEDMTALQFMQWSLSQYLVSVLHTVSPLLGSPSLDVVTTALQLLKHVLPLLQEAIEPSLLWGDHSVTALEIAEKLQESFEILADALQYHHHSSLAAATPSQELSQHQVAFIGIANFVSELLKFSVPTAKVTSVVPDLCRGMLTTLALDSTLSLSHPEVRQACLPFVEIASPAVYDDAMKARRVCQAQKATVDFLNKWPEQVAVNIEELVALAEAGVDSLSYHQHLPFVDACIQLASHVCRKSKLPPECIQRSRKLLLGLLAHPLDHIKIRAYTTCRDIVMDALGVGHAADPNTNASHAVTFLLHRHVLYEISCFGLSDSVKKVEEIASQIVLHLLQGQLLMPATRWQQFLESVIPVLPVLQGFAAQEKGMGGCILGLLEAQPHIQTGTLSMHERLRGTLRLMYRQETRMRTEGLGRLAWFLSQESEATKKMPQFSDLQVGDLTNLLLVQQPTYLQEEDDDRSVFQEDGLRKVFDIFASEMVEDDVKKAAIDQLGIMLQDPALHKSFTALNGTTFVINHLHAGLKRPEYGTQNPSQVMLPSLIKILRHLVQRNYSLRHQLAADTAIYYSVFRVALMYSGDEDTKKEVSQLLALLLWDEVASVATWDTDAETSAQKALPFSLPTFVTTRYRMPFRCSTHHSHSPYGRPVPLAADPLWEGLIGQSIRLDWHINWSGGIEALVKFCARPIQSEDNGYTGPLELNKVDQAVLKASHLPSVVCNLIHEVQNATSHRAVSQGISAILSYLICSGVERVGHVLADNKWHDAIDRFFRVRPSSTVDESLLSDILVMLIQLLSVKGPLNPVLTSWLSNVLHAEQGALVTVLARSDQVPDDLPETTQQVRRSLNRDLLKFLQIYIAKVPYYLSRKPQEQHCIRGIVTQACLARLSASNTPHFYNLASLERTLLVLVHITARPGWSIGAAGKDSLTICLHTLNMLLEVVSAFHVGRGGLSMSYMGRGVTRSATLCLRHLAHEMSSCLQSQDWPRNWLFNRQGVQDAESGLGWLTTLWTYRDAEVRAAGFGIAVALTSTESGRLTMATQCQHIHGGVWGAAFSVLLDHSECSLVRQQAALLLVNLTSCPLSSGPDDVETSLWLGPVIRNDHTQESLVGLPALMSLLQHTQFFHEILVILSNYYPQSAIHPVSVSADHNSGTLASSQNTLTTSGSVATLTDQQEGVWKPVTSTPLSGDSTPRDDSTVPPQGAVQQSANAPGHQVSDSPPERVASTATTSVASGSVAEYQSVAGPGLVANISQLLRNIVHLAPQQTVHALSTDGVLKTLTGLLDVGLLETYVKDLNSAPIMHLKRVAFADQLRVHTGVVCLLQACVSHDPAVLDQFLHESTALRHLALLLTISYQAHGDLAAQCERLWESVLTLFRVLLYRGGQPSLDKLSPVLTRHWSTIAARCIHILQTTSYIDSSLWFSVLDFLAVLFVEEGRAEVSVCRAEGMMTITYRLESSPKPGSSGPQLLAGPSGGILCSALVHLYDTVSLQQGERALPAKQAVTTTLRSLLTISLAAKATALEGGLVETLSDQIRRLTMTMNMDALETPKVGKSKKKDNPATTELIIILELLRNFMYNCYDVKLAAYECGLAQCIHKLWAWAQIDPQLLTSVLALLSTLTARCPTGCSSLVFTSAMGVVERNGSQGQYSTHSMVHCLIKLARKGSGSGGNVANLKSTFAILATISLSQECRGVLWKSNFLHEFSNLCPKRPKKTRIQQALELCWLKLMLNLSFSTDGQGMILKINDAVSLLVEYADGSSESQIRSSILTLHNLCFHAANKPKLLANARISPLLVDNVENSSGEIRTIAASALFALAYNSQKAKVALKTTATVRRLQETYNCIVQDSTKPPEEADGVEHLKSLLSLLKA